MLLILFSIVINIHLINFVISNKIFMNLHISHSGGTYICRLAIKNQERVNNRLNCNLNSDATKTSKYRTCEERRRENIISNYTFIATERALIEGEYCPDQFSYILFMRNPLNVVNSAFSWRGVENISQLMSFAESNTGYVDEFLRLFKRPNQPKTIQIPKIPVLYRADNYFTRFLAFNASAHFAPWSKITQEHYETALTNLKKFDIVFTDEDLTFHFDEVAKVIESKLHWNTSLMQIYNSTILRNSHGPHRFNKELEDFILDLNKYDMMLYQQAHRYYNHHHYYPQKKHH